jgi:hypothetical protein
MMSAAIVSSEDRLFPNARGRTTAIVLGATCAALVVLRLLTVLDPDGFNILLASSMILLFLVALTYGCAAFCLIRKLFGRAVLS